MGVKLEQCIHECGFIAVFLAPPCCCGQFLKVIRLVSRILRIKILLMQTDILEGVMGRFYSLLLKLIIEGLRLGMLDSPGKTEEEDIRLPVIVEAKFLQQSALLRVKIHPDIRITIARPVIA